MTHPSRPRTAGHDAEDLAEDLASPDRLLPGEASAMSSRYRADAQHWAEVYAELFGFKQALLATLNEQRRRVTGEGVHEVQSDEIMITREADRLATRLEYWKGELRNPERTER